MTEFELIDRFFKAKAARLAQQRRDTGSTSPVRLGIGDDCALLQPDSGQQIAISTDMLVENRHFLPDVAPDALGHKALAVNLSDLAAMGAEPLGFTLALALPPERAADETWLDAFGDGLLKLATEHACPLVGGDTTAGPLNLCITVFGQVHPGQALRRDGARPGDEIWVSGTLGDARLALGVLRAEWSLPPGAFAAARARLERPAPRLALGLALRGIATSCLDVSDGLIGDLGHILDASGVGATLREVLLPQPAALAELPATEASLWGTAARRALLLAGGDDYELAFTAPPERHAAVLTAGAHTGVAVACIGRITAGSGLRVLDAAGDPVDIHALHSFDHFAN
ncbi:MAG: thiamine-phosphate kinase [Burkholderiaceae bacterium]|nr:MAG: thiamine-phosphate kinase [Burkholderiaceae bacterium]